MTRRSAFALVFSSLLAATLAPSVRAGTLLDPVDAGFAPRVPLSAFAQPMSWFDPSRLHLASTVSVGSGWGGRTSALQVTSFAYQFRAPFSMSVSVGNTFGLDRATSGRNPFFLEGLDLAWRPSRNTLFRVEMHDVRSPLQYGYGPWYRGAPGYDPTFAPY